MLEFYGKQKLKNLTNVVNYAVEQSPSTIFSSLVQKIKSYNTEADTALLETAFALAHKAHEGQVRKSGEPYIVHPLSVASIIAELKLDVPSVCAGLLHDCVEDTDVCLTEITERFSEEVAALVDGVTKLGKIPWNTREERQAENFRKMLVAMAKDIRVVLIKLADRLDNMRTLQHMKEEKQERIAKETMEIYAPLANRLGIYWVRAELEDLSFRYLYPHEYQRLTDELAASEAERRAYIKKVEDLLRKLMSENHVACDVHGRPKNLWGIHAKMRETERPLDQIHDSIAFRVVTHSIRDCYAALGVVHEHFVPIPGRFKDYVAMPKPNRYQSLHSTLVGPDGKRMEVQIRTHEMHRVAEEGIAAHWVYKEGKSVLSSEDQQKFAWLRQLIEFQRELKDPTEFLDAVRVDLFSDEVYVFTPAGEVKAFPTGSTPVDFAYAIHTEVGHRCSGAKVNGQLVPLRYQLQNGDTIEIVTSHGQKPNKDWLKFTVTARARSKIRHFIRGEQRLRARDFGGELLERELRKHDLSFAKLQKEGELQRLAQELRCGKSEEDLLLQIGFGKLTAAQVVRAVTQGVTDGGTAAEPEQKRNPIARIIEKVRKRAPTGAIYVQGQNDVLIRYAHCCDPLPGDPIVGFITRGRGVTIHKLDCSKALDLDPERRIEVEWDSAAKVEHRVSIDVYTADKPGILAEISKAFTKAGINISQAHCRVTDDNRAVNTFQFHVMHLDHLKHLIKEIQRIKGVNSVVRAGGK